MTEDAQTTVAAKPKPDNALWLTSYITVADMPAYIRFAEQGLGFTLGNTMNGDDGTPMHAEFEYKGQVVLMACPEGALGTTGKAPSTQGVALPANFYLYVDDVDTAFAAAKAAGAQIDEPPTDQFWGDRTARFTDPSGYGWMIGTHTGKEFAPDM